jgi:putative SOS response-associated peptidase YedK
MCARVTATSAEIADLFGLSHDLRQPKLALKPLYAAAPSVLLRVVRVTRGVREVAELRWGTDPACHTSRAARTRRARTCEPAKRAVRCP